MTVNVAERTCRYDGDGTTDTFSITFQFYDVAVYLDGVLQHGGVDYTLVGGNGNTGSCVFNSPPDDGVKVVIIGNTPPSQGTNIQDFDDSPADVVERIMDKAVMLAAETVERLGRTIRAPHYNTDIPALDFDNSPGTAVVVDEDGVIQLMPFAQLSLIAAEVADAFDKGSDDADDISEGAANLFLTVPERTKLGHISVTQGVDLDAMETRLNALDAAVVLRGVWDASGGSFPGSGTAQAGESWIVSIGGTVGGATFTAGDRIIAITDNASTVTFTANWFKSDYTDQVSSVAGRTGSVTLAASDITDASANAQSLIQAADYAAMRGLLDLEVGTDFLSPAAIAAAYAPLASPVLTGSPTAPTPGSLAEDSTRLATTEWVQDVVAAAVIGAGAGDVAGPGGSTDNALPRFDGTGGKTLQGSTATLSDIGTLTLSQNQDAASYTPLALANTRATQAAFDQVGIDFFLKDSAGNLDGMGRFLVQSTAITSGAESARAILQLRSAGSNVGRYFWTPSAFHLDVSDAASLGTATVGWSDLYLASGGQIDWSNGGSRIAGFGSNGVISYAADPSNAFANSAHIFQVDGVERARISPDGLEIGHASDTTLARIAAGRASLEGSELVTLGLGITATGGSTARTLANRFGERLSLLDFGGNGDGSTSNNSAIDDALLVTNEIFVPPGDFTFSGSDRRAAVLDATFYGPGRLFYDNGAGYTEQFGSILRLGVADQNGSDGALSQGGVVYGGEGGSGHGVITYASHTGWFHAQPTRLGQSLEAQFFSNGYHGIGEAQVGSDVIVMSYAAWFVAEDNFAVGDVIGFGRSIYRIASKDPGTSSFTVSEVGGGAVAFGSTFEATVRHVYHYATGTCDTSGTTVTRVSGDQFFDLFAFGGNEKKLIVDGSEYEVSTFNNVDSLTLGSSAGSQSGVPFVLKILPTNSPSTLLRIQGLAGGSEENLALYITMNGHARIESSFAGSGSYMPVAISAGGIDMDNIVAELNGSVRIGALAADPVSNLANGQMYYNSVTNKFRGRAAGAWVDIH